MKTSVGQTDGGQSASTPAKTGLPVSELTKRQSKTYGPRPVSGYGAAAQITAKVRYDDECGNGHNTFSITAEIRAPECRDAGGCLHDEIAKSFPELAPFIKWHLVSSDGPLHYVDNTVYHASVNSSKDRQLDYARTSAVWPEATDEQLCLPKEELKALLLARLPALMCEFKAAVEFLGFTY